MIWQDKEIQKETKPICYGARYWIERQRAPSNIRMLLTTAYAKEINRKSNFDYGVHDAPNIFRRGSLFTQLLLQFKKYPTKELEVMADMVPLFSNKTSKQQRAVFWATYFLIAGMTQVPFGDWLDDIITSMFPSLKHEFRKFVMANLNDNPIERSLGKIMLYGMGSLAGVDISSRTGIADILPTKMTDALGPTLNTIYQFAKADNWMSSLRAISPGLYNIAAMAEGESLGNRGRINDHYDTVYEPILRGMGFRSTDEAINSDIQQIYYDDKNHMKDEKQKAVDNYLENPTTDNAARLKELGVKLATVKAERERKNWIV